MKKQRQGVCGTCSVTKGRLRRLPLLFSLARDNYYWCKHIWIHHSLVGINRSFIWNTSDVTQKSGGGWELIGFKSQHSLVSEHTPHLPLSYYHKIWAWKWWTLSGQGAVLPTWWEKQLPSTGGVKRGLARISFQGRLHSKTLRTLIASKCSLYSIQ